MDVKYVLQCERETVFHSAVVLLSKEQNFQDYNLAEKQLIKKHL